LLTYCDSSALVVLVAADEGGRQPIVKEVLTAASDVVGCEWISPLEVTAAIHRRLPLRRRGDAEKRWWQIWAGMVPVTLDGQLYELALAAAATHRLRSLDALHLAAALRIGCTRMLTFDEELAAAARSEGVAVAGT